MNLTKRSQYAMSLPIFFSLLSPLSCATTPALSSCRPWWSGTTLGWAEDTGGPSGTVIVELMAARHAR